MNLVSSYSPLVSDDNEYFKSRYLENAYKVNSQLNIAYANYGIVYPNVINGSGYASVNCDYKETPITESTDTEDINATRTITTSINGNIVTTRLTYTLNDTDDMTTTFNRVSPSINHVLNLNVTSKTMIVTSNTEIIFNQTTANNIELVNVYCDYDFTNLYRGCYVFISDGSNEYEVYETPVSFSGTPTPLSTYYEISPSDSITIKGYSVSNVPQREGFTTFTEGTFPFTCEVLEGGQVIRTFQNNGNIPSYLDYKDTYLNVDLGTLNPTTSDSNGSILLGGSELSNTQKLIYAIFLSILIGVALLFITSTENVNPTTSGLIAGVGLIGALIVFGVVGWLPPVAIIIMIILSAGIVAILLRNGVSGA